MGGAWWVKKGRGSTEGRRERGAEGTWEQEGRVENRTKNEEDEREETWGGG